MIKNPNEMTNEELQCEMELILEEMATDENFKNVKLPEDLKERVMSSIIELKREKGAERLIDFIFKK